MAYASVSDLELRYGELPDDDARARASALLADAAAYIDRRADVDPGDEGQAAILTMVSCAMVNRAMSAQESEAFGISNASYTMGPFSQSATFANPSGDLYLTSGEMRLLGVGSARIGTIRPVIGVRHA